MKTKEQNQHFYELNCLVGLRSSERIAELAKKIEDWVEKKKGELVEVEKVESPESKGGKAGFWVERKRLAYPIKKDKAGYYINSWIKLDPAEVKDLKRFLKLEKDVVRFAILADKNIANPHPNRDAVTLDEIGQLVSQTQPRKYAPREETPRPAPAEIKEEKKEPEVIKVEEPVIEKEQEEVVEKPKKAKIEKKAEDVKPEVKEEKVEPEIIEEKEEKEEITKEASQKEEVVAEKEEKDSKEEKKEKAAKRKKITLEELDQRLDDILNEDIL